MTAVAVLSIEYKAGPLRKARNHRTAISRDAVNRGTVVFALARVCAGIGTCASRPRQADLRGLEPAEIARLEMAMWRDHYEKGYAALFRPLYEVSRNAVRLRAAGQLRIALAAAQAAKVFQPAGSRGAATGALQTQKSPERSRGF